MDVSLDTDKVIHLFEANQETLLFEFFDRLYIYSYLFEKELLNAKPSVLHRVKNAVNEGKIHVVDDAFLTNINMQTTFQQHVEHYAITNDRGQMFAIALALTMGYDVIATNDIQKYGPHHTMMQRHSVNLVPLSFYEILFFKNGFSHHDTN